jgi:hypothetical protein
MARKSSNNNGGNSDENNNWKDALPPGLDAYVRHIDKDWNDLTLDVANTTTKRVNGFLLNNIIYYRKQSYTDYKLWEYFREDFEDWTLDTWKLGHTEVVREFRDFLRRNGVYVVKNEALIASNIHAVITNPEEPVWTQEEIQKQMNEPQTNLFSNEGNFNSKRNPHRKPITTHIPPTPTSNLPKPLQSNQFLSKFKICQRILLLLRTFRKPLQSNQLSRYLLQSPFLLLRQPLFLLLRLSLHLWYLLQLQ